VEGDAEEGHWGPMRAEHALIWQGRSRCVSTRCSVDLLDLPLPPLSFLTPIWLDLHAAGLAPQADVRLAAGNTAELGRDHPAAPAGGTAAAPQRPGGGADASARQPHATRGACMGKVPPAEGAFGGPDEPIAKQEKACRQCLRCWRGGLRRQRGGLWPSDCNFSQAGVSAISFVARRPPRDSRCCQSSDLFAPRCTANTCWPPGPV
jgi:hypothetical protein